MQAGVIVTSTVCTAFGLNGISLGAPTTLAERWSRGRWRIQPTPGLVANDSGLVGVACPSVSACFAVASYTNNGFNLPNLTLVEQWTSTPGSSSAAGRPAAPGGAAPGCATSPALKFPNALRANPMPLQRESIARALTNRTSAMWPAQACRM